MCHKSYLDDYADRWHVEDFEAAKAKAMKIGAVACYVEDIRREFVEALCFPAIQANAIYENVYLLGECWNMSRSNWTFILILVHRHLTCSSRHRSSTNQSCTEGRMHCCLARLYRQGKRPGPIWTRFLRSAAFYQGHCSMAFARILQPLRRTEWPSRLCRTIWRASLKYKE